MPKQDEQDRMAGPFHSFRVIHHIRPGHGAGGWSEILSEHLSPAAARDLISRIAKEHKIPQQEEIHPAEGVPLDVAAALGVDGPPAAGQATLDQVTGQDPPAPGGPAGGGEEASGGDA